MLQPLNSSEQYQLVFSKNYIKITLINYLGAFQLPYKADFMFACPTSSLTVRTEAICAYQFKRGIFINSSILYIEKAPTTFQ